MKNHTICTTVAYVYRRANYSWPIIEMSEEFLNSVWLDLMNAVARCETRIHTPENSFKGRPIPSAPCVRHLWSWWMQSRGAKRTYIHDIHTHQDYKRKQFKGPTNPPPPPPPLVYDICGEQEIITVGCARSVCVCVCVCDLSVHKLTFAQCKQTVLSSYKSDRLKRWEGGRGVERRDAASCLVCCARCIWFNTNGHGNAW